MQQPTVTYPDPIPPKRGSIIPRRIREFMETESAGGIIMMLFAALAIVIANSPFADLYRHFISTPLTLSFNESVYSEPLKHWVKDVLMVFFFLLIGLELKREMVEGFLSKRDQILLPLFAALGGMAIPAFIFLSLNYQHPDTIHGWAIPSATDIAFALAVLSIAGKGIPPSVKLFLLAIAIFDDLGAIMVIALFYNTDLSVFPLLLATGGAVVLYALNRLGVTLILPYLLVGTFLWFCFHHSGIHTTLAGVIVGFAIPLHNTKRQDHSPLGDCMKLLHPWVSFMILPLFAFTSAGVDLSGLSAETLFSPLPLGIALGLFIGKPIGIFGVSFLLIKYGKVSMPESARWRDLYAVSVIAGVGFTMSLFIGMLAFSTPLIQEWVKAGVLSGSMLCIIWAALIMRLFCQSVK